MTSRTSGHLFCEGLVRVVVGSGSILSTTVHHIGCLPYSVHKLQIADLEDTEHEVLY